MRESLDDTEAKLLSLLGFINGDILYVTDTAETAEELAFDEDGAYSNNLVARFVEDDDGEICTRACAHGVELVDPRYLAEVVDDG
jgi:hypothetical protein